MAAAAAAAAAAGAVVEHLIGFSIRHRQTLSVLSDLTAKVIEIYVIWSSIVQVLLRSTTNRSLTQVQKMNVIV